MKFISFVYYKIIKYNTNAGDEAKYKYVYSFIHITFLICFNFFSVFLVVSNFFNFDFDLIYSPINGLLNKFIFLPLVVTPFFILIYSFYFFKRKSINEYLKKFDLLEEKDKKQLNFYFYLYIISSIAFLLFSIISPAIFR